MSDFSCNSDPLCKFIESFLRGLLREKIGPVEDGPSLSPVSNVHQPINHNTKVTDGSNAIQCVEIQFDSDTLVSEFAQLCARCYKTNIFRSSVKDAIPVLFNWQFFLDAQSLWREFMFEKNWKTPTEPNFTSSYSACPPIETDLTILSAVESKDKFKSLEINLSVASVAEATILWITDNYPRACQRSHSHLLDSCTIRVAAYEVKGPTGKMPLSQYRKFLTCRFIAVALAKSGHVVDTNKFFVLPPDSNFMNDVFIMSTNNKGKKTCQRVSMGNVTVRESKDCSTGRDMTTEYFHNLCLQDVTSCGLLDGESAKDGIDLSWTVSASNLATAMVHFDLLQKNPAVHMEILMGKEKEKLPMNTGVLFIMYNYSRVVSVLKKFASMRSSNKYPPLPSAREIDFSLLTSKEEVSLLNVLWEWPRILDNSIDLVQQDMDILTCLKTIKEMALRFNTFYVSSMVLTQSNAPHTFPRMLARVHLLRACRLIFEEFFELLQIEFNQSPNSLMTIATECEKSYFNQLKDSQLPPIIKCQ